MAEELPDGTIGAYAGYCGRCGQEIKTNIQGNELGKHYCKAQTIINDGCVVVSLHENTHVLIDCIYTDKCKIYLDIKDAIILRKFLTNISLEEFL